MDIIVMKNNNLKKLSVLSNEELFLIEGGGLSEITSEVVEGIAYFFGRLAAHRSNYSGSALLGPNGRVTG